MFGKTEETLNRDHADAIIIGGGIIGCAIAYNLAKRDIKPILIDKASTVGTEASWAGAGILTSHASTHEPYPTLCRASLERYPALAEELRAETQIDIEFIQSGTLSVFFNQAEAAGLIGLADRRVKRGFSAELLTPEQAWQLEPALSKSIVGAVLFPEDAQVRNPKMVTALAKGAAKLGAKFRLGNPVTNFVKEGGRVIGVVVNGETLYADTCVIAAGCWAGTLMTQLGVPIQIEPVKGQIVLVETMPPLFRHVVDGLGIYIVPRADGKVLLGATVEFVGYDKTATVDGAKQMIDAGIAIAPQLADSTFVQTWAGLRPYAKKGPLLGYLPGYDNVVLASGHFKNGILLAPITGQLIAELLTTGQPSLPLEPFQPEVV
ncbi:glycine oxidase ThiO [Candidatus Poribacteria bacterium]|nr:glycine oxidase ThiO [Candidatus Poribacteria bacterium]MYK22487.1 glycine oxidase ThiO [Candidatus Poribacteria bacterium]